MEETQQVRFEKLVFGGDCLGRLPDGKAVFVPFALPGEVGEVALTEVKETYARGLLVNVLEPSPLRIKPPCPHFADCGGCHYQHLDYAHQLDVKLDIVADQLRRGARIEQPPISGITRGENPYYYRNQVQFHVLEDGSLAFLDITGRTPFKVLECHLPSPGLLELLPILELEEGHGLRRLTLREDSHGERLLLLDGEEELAPEMEIAAEISAVYRNPAGQTFNLAGEDHLTYEILGKVLSISPESFFQVNTGVAEKMVGHVLGLLNGRQGMDILELYSGAGLFSTFLAEHARRLTAIESSPPACFDFANNLDAYEHVSLYEGAVEHVLPALIGELESPDLALLDPPRAGLHAKARQALLKLAPREIIYISCDPSTLARDLRELLGKGYELRDVQVFDMFPQTYHVETMTVLRRTQRVTS